MVSSLAEIYMQKRSDSAHHFENSACSKTEIQLQGEAVFEAAGRRTKSAKYTARVLCVRVLSPIFFRKVAQPASISRLISAGVAVAVLTIGVNNACGSEAVAD